MAMKIELQLTPKAVLAELGRRLARRRFDLGIWPIYRRIVAIPLDG